LGYHDVVLADLPALFWPLNETSGAVANDISGNGRHGTIAGMGYNRPSFMAGDPGPGLRSIYPNNPTQVTRAHESWMNSDSITYEVWGKPDATSTVGGGNVVFGMDDQLRSTWGYSPESNNGNYQGVITTDIRNQLNQGGQHSGTPGSCPPGVGSHIVLSYDAVTDLLRLYRNGVQRHQWSFADGIRNGTATLQLGGANWGWDWMKFAVYTYALPADRVLAHYNVGMGL
jgi:hypothetical protein